MPSIDPVKLVSAVMQSDAIHSRYRQIELDNNRLIAEYTSSVRFAIMMNDYCRVTFTGLSIIVSAASRKKKSRGDGTAVFCREKQFFHITIYTLITTYLFHVA
jgi:hypothetical protein